jgi:hypothetical protein
MTERNGIPEAKPQVLPVNPDGIPEELRQGRRFVLWRYEFRDGKWTKPPYRPDGTRADSTDPATWATFAEVMAAYGRGGWDGIGRVHLPEDTLIGADADHCVDPSTGEVSGADAVAIRDLDTYTERSPSGTGLRAFCRGRKPGRKCKKGGFELYDGLTAKGKPGGRYLTLTGHRLDGSPSTVNDRQAEVEAVYRRYWPEPPGPEGSPPPMPVPPTDGGRTKGKARGGNCPLPLNEDEVRRWACLGPDKQTRILALWGGDVSAYNDDDSRADLALCRYLVIITNGDRQRAEQLFTESRLGDRDKWRSRADYRERTLNVALDGHEPWRDDPAERNGRAHHRQAAPASDDGDENGDPEGGDEDPNRRRFAKDIIREYWLARYDLSFRRENSVYSAKLGQELRLSQLLAEQTTEVMFRLRGAVDAPIGEDGKPKWSQMPKLFATWARVAWGDLLKQLDFEGATGEITDPAQEEFRDKVGAALLTMVSLAYSYKGGDGVERSEVERRSLLDWCQQFAKVGGWQSVRGYKIWCKKAGTPPTVQVAIRPELFGQLHFPDLAKIKRRKFTDLCRLYGVGLPCKVSGGDDRAVGLSGEFLRNLAAVPLNDADGRTDGSACAHASDMRPSEAEIDASASASTSSTGHRPRTQTPDTGDNSRATSGGSVRGNTDREAGH